MAQIRHILLIAVLMLSGEAIAQLSPGDLTTAHADLEGMSNCTKCHVLGNKVSNAKCLDCHKEIKSLIAKKRGYHASSKVLKEDCIKCHSEHHGRKFDMVRFDEKKFDHNLTSYRLEGKHDEVDCKECHKPANIQNAKLSQRKKTFLGLEKKCLSCHDDYHQQTLSTKCVNCHDMKGFASATKFEHDKTEFKLTGKHEGIDCIECHKKTRRNGKDFQIFTDVAFGDCKSCHDDPHNSRISGKCKSCHTDKSFSIFTGRNRFNHNTTRFKLKGKHRRIDCFTCHDRMSNPRLVFGDRKGVSENKCVECHEDIHEGKFGDDCAQCHNEKSFLQLKSMDFFNHDQTDYALEGKHIGVECKECHITKYTDPIDFSACVNCHADYHNGEFRKKGEPPDCAGCHSLQHDFDYTLYTLDRHQESVFPLEGAHIATPCYACHISEDQWTFRNIGTECITCHTDEHEGVLSEKYYPEKDCKHCHNNDGWTDVSFDHDSTSWPLTGQHTGVSCKDCHLLESAKKGTFKIDFINTEGKCSKCHEDHHEGKYSKNGETVCSSCHNPENWYPISFDHSKTAFPLDGKHAGLVCNQCHERTTNDGESVILFKIGKFECVDCHL